jgi:hypothetical protein
VISQLTLQQDVALAEAAADQGMAQALRAERVQAWKEAAGYWLFDLPPGHTFVADDLVAVVGLPDSGPGKNNVVGAWISAQAKAGRIVWTGEYRKSARVVGHGNRIMEWRLA